MIKRYIILTLSLLFFTAASDGLSQDAKWTNTAQFIDTDTEEGELYVQALEDFASIEVGITTLTDVMEMFGSPDYFMDKRGQEAKTFSTSMVYSGYPAPAENEFVYSFYYDAPMKDAENEWLKLNIAVTVNKTNEFVTNKGKNVIGYVVNYHPEMEKY